MAFTKITEMDSLYDDLEKASTISILENINNEDQKVALAVKNVLPQIENLVNAIVPKLRAGGRLFYIGAGTSGRLGILDASECPPTFGVDDDVVIGLIAGGDTAIRKAAENAEDNMEMAQKDLEKLNINDNDFVIGIAASGTTPYVLGGLKFCIEHNIATGCITCNPQSPITTLADYPIEVVVGPEFITGSSRMKAGTAQKMILNMISTTAMIQLGRVKGNKMVDMKLSNQKLHQRAINMVMNALNINKEEAEILIKKYGNTRKAIENYEQ